MFKIIKNIIKWFYSLKWTYFTIYYIFINASTYLMTIVTGV